MTANAITATHGAVEQFAGIGAVGRSDGQHTSAPRDERGNPLGHPSFAGVGHPSARKTNDNTTSMKEATSL